MWSGFDPEIRRQLEDIRKRVARQHQTPTQEWPLVVAGRDDTVLVVRQWPDGEITVFTASKNDS